jgi:hypothetical protein
MKPTIIIDKTRALQAEVDDLAKAIETGNLDRTQNLLGALQRSNALLLRLLEVQISGASGARRNRSSHAPVMTLPGRRHSVGLAPGSNGALLFGKNLTRI